MISIVVINQNTSEHTINFLQSILESDPLIPTEFIVVDNGSKDNSTDKIRRHLPYAQVISIDEPTSKSKALNFGLSRVIGEYVLLADPRVQFDEKKSLTRCLNQLSALGSNNVLGIRLIENRGLQMDFSFTTIPSIRNVFQTQEEDPVKPKSRAFVEVPYLGIQCVLFSSQMLNNGGRIFDEHFYLGGEELEWSYNLKKNSGTRFYLAEDVQGSIDMYNDHSGDLVGKMNQLINNWIFIRKTQSKGYFKRYKFCLRVRTSKWFNLLRSTLKSAQKPSEKLRRNLENKLIRFGLNHFADRIQNDFDSLCENPIRIQEYEAEIFKALK